MSLSPAAQRVLRAVAATLVPDGPADLGDRVAAKVATLPRPADRAELDLLLRLLDIRAVNLLLSGIPTPFTRILMLYSPLLAVMNKVWRSPDVASCVGIPPRPA